MRLVVEATDYDDAIAFYRDTLGLPEELFVESDGGALVTILDAGRATLELSNPAQVAYIDDVEVGRRVAPRLRIAFEVADAEQVTDRLVSAGAELVAPPTRTPWNSVNSRLEAPAGLQLTLFQELAPESPRLYTDLADWFHLLTAPREYAEEATQYRRLLESAGPVRTVLELGSGGGNNASHLKRHFQMTLADRSPEMVRQSRSINPECEHVVGDMRSLRLDRRFDAVFIHDAIGYLTTLDDLRAAMQTAFAHLRPGGVALLCPDEVRDSFAPGTEHGGNDEGERGLRYLQWTWDPDPSDTTYVADFAYLLRDGTQVRVERDRHTLGLFARDDWLTALRDTGFRHVESRPGPEGGTEVFLAQA